ncbi:tail fiber assembly protein [Pseudomonas sp. SDO528_S397]
MPDNVQSDIPSAPAFFIPQVEWAAIRSHRDQLLRASDFTQLPDFPASEAQRAEITAYRKTLRDIPQQDTDPSKVVWPTLPAFLK